MKPQRGPWPGKLAFYIDVDDLDTYSEKIRQAGGKIVVEKMDVPGVGQLSLFEDPDGRVLGMWQKKIAIFPRTSPQFRAPRPESVAPGSQPH